jgi:hypothetical protein
MQSIKDKILSHLGHTGNVAITFTQEEVKHLHDLLTDSYTKLLSGPNKETKNNK